MTEINVTAEQLIAYIKESLEPDFGHAMLRFSRQHLANQDGFLVLYNSVLKGTTGVAVDNAFSAPKFSFYAAPGFKWLKGEPAPEKIKVEMFSGAIHLDKNYRGPKVPFRAKSGSPEKVVEYFVKFFVDNKEALLP